MKLGRLILRLIVGGYFFGHGTQKLFGWFGGYGPEGTGQFFESIGLRPGKHHAVAAGAAEAGGGALLVAGAATPVAASVLTATMVTAINRVHLKTGPGSPSIDDAIGAKWHGPKWALRSLVLGVIGAVGAHIVAERAPQPEPAPAEPEAAPTEAPAQAAPSAS